MAASSCAMAGVERRVMAIRSESLACAKGSDVEEFLLNGVFVGLSDGDVGLYAVNFELRPVEGFDFVDTDDVGLVDSHEE